jgi:TonB-linked SusC/RagA family outer membrane protein
MKLIRPHHIILLLTGIVALAGEAAAQAGNTDTVIQLTYKKGEKYIGYGKQPENIITSAISTVKGTDLRKSFTNNISNTFYGRFAGLTVNQGGNEPGANSSTPYIRGVNTFGFSQAPVVIIDGFLGDYSQLVPEEIEEISVLKDASALAVYGMRGANGVILVTTKKGKVQPLSVDFGAQYGYQQATALPKFLGSYDYARLYNEALANDGKAPLYSQADLSAYQNGSDPLFHPNVNWYNQVLRDKAPLSNYNLSLTGGNGTVRFFTTLNVLTSGGLYKNFGNDFPESSNATYNRYNFRTNVEVTLNKNLTAQLNIGGSVEEKSNPSDLYTGTNLALIDRIAPNAFPVFNANGSFGGNSTYSGNPLANLTSTGFSTSNGTSLQSSLRMTQALPFITPGLSAGAAVSFNNYYVGGSNKRKTYQRFSVSKNTAGDTLYSGFGQLTSLSPEESVLSQFRNYAIQGNVSYDHNFGNNSLSAMVLFNSDNFDIDRGYTATDAANQAFPYRANSLSSRITYVHNGKYIAEFSSGYMGTENYPKDHRYGFFPAGSIGWIASNESFLKNVSFLSFLKLRASYGLTGNENIGGQRFAFAQRYPFSASYYLGTGNTAVTSIGEGRRANPDVTWEKEKKANVGLDLNLGKHIGIVVDVFKNDRYDISTTSNGTLPQFLGYNGYPDLNIGKATNKGYEVSVRYNSDEKKAIQFFAEAIVSYAKNKIVFNGEPANPNTNLYKTGFAIGQPFGLQALGLFQSDAEIAASAVPLGVSIKPGDIKYRDIGGPNGVPDGIIDGNDVTAIGKTSIPEYTAGLHTGLRYKGFDVDLLFQGVTGVTQYLGGTRFAAFQSNGQIAELALGRWTPQTAATATYPRLSSENSNQNNYRFSSFWQRDGSFVKLRSAEIGYTFSDKTLKRLHLSGTRLFVNGTNLFTWDRIKEGDADALYGYPQLRTLSVGVKLHL